MKNNLSTNSVFNMNTHTHTHCDWRHWISGYQSHRSACDSGVQGHDPGRAGSPRHHAWGEGSQGRLQATGSGRHQIHLPVCREHLQQWVVAQAFGMLMQVRWLMCCFITPPPSSWEGSSLPHQQRRRGHVSLQHHWRWIRDAVWRQSLG